MFKKSFFFKLINFWPPFLGAGIRVKNISSDFRSIDVEMKLRRWNRNYVGTHFGGSLYAMTDPFLMLMLIENLGRDYIVWDKAASIWFKKPGRDKVHVSFRLSAEEIKNIKNLADNNHKTEPVFKVQVLSEDQELVAEVEKVLYVKRKDKSRNGGT